MDPVTHTLFGNQLSASGLGRTSALAPATLLIAVNLPDIDFVTYFINPDLALEVRRGITHGIFAMALLPLVLTASMWAVHVLRHRFKPDPQRPRFRPFVVLFLAYLGVMSHPLLDWLNTYGVRFLAPRKDTWFYGDTLFIVDPWIWLLFGGAAYLRYGEGPRFRRAAWVVAAMMTAAVVMGSPSSVASVVWVVGLVGVLWLGRSSRLLDWARRGHVAQGAILLAFGYVLLLMGGDHMAENEVRRQLAARGTAINGMMIGPTPINPLRRDVIVRSGDRYTFGVFDWLSHPRFRVTDDTTRLPGPDPEVAAALAAPCVRGMVGWLRYPIVEVDSVDEGYDVYLLDARYARQRQAGFGTARVHIDAAFEPACAVR